jgi:hypothetical protein
LTCLSSSRYFDPTGACCPTRLLLVKVSVGADDGHKHITIFFGAQTDTAVGLHQGCCLIRPNPKACVFL